MRAGLAGLACRDAENATMPASASAPDATKMIEGYVRELNLEI
jgi:hypothetical protein